MLKQILASLVVLVVAAAGYVYFVPGSDATLKALGINVSVPTAYAATDPPAAAGAAATPGAGGQAGAAAGGQGGARAGAGGGGRPGGRGAAVPTVITGPVTISTINDKLTAIGQGKAAQSVSVTTQATGTLETLTVKAGDTVKAGQAIGQLDADSEQIAYDKAQLADKDAQDTLTRTQSLAKSNNATTVQLAASQLAVDNANLELRNAKLDLDKRAITTPIDGKVGLFQVTPGNAVGAQTVVTTVDDTSSILVDYWVPERYAPVVKAGMPVSATATALPDHPFDGVVSAVDSRIDPASRTLQVEAKVPNVTGAITPGMSFEVSMAFPGDNYPAVDPLTIQWGSSGAYVWLLTADSKVKKDPVQIIQRNSDGVLVKGDVKPGDQIVTQGVLLLTEGATVRRINDEPTTTTADAGASPPAGAAATPPAGTAAAPAAGGSGTRRGNGGARAPAATSGTAPAAGAQSGAAAR